MIETVLSEPAFDPATLVATLRDRLSGGSAHFAAVLIPRPAAAPAAPKVAPVPAPRPRLPTLVALLPDEEHMSDSDKRQVQAALRLGYYDGTVEETWPFARLSTCRRRLAVTASTA